MTAAAPVPVLFISCWSLREPQCQRLNLDPLRHLAGRGYRVHMITFERPPYRGAAGDERRWRDELAAQGIAWYPIAYHHRPLLLAKLRDGLAALRAGLRIVRRARIRLVHARSEFPAVVAVALGRLRRLPVAYESDALISEERVDVGVWRRGSLVHRVTRAFERRLPAASDEMVVLTRRYAERLRADGVGVPITVLPSCTDIERFRRDPATRGAVRREQKWDERLVVVYSGQTGGWYQFDDMARFVARLHAAVPATHWLCLVNDDPDAVRARVAACGVAADAVTVRSVPPEAVSGWLAACDVALSFIRSGTSKFASSPTKTAEYLACGLPILTTPGVGDMDDLATDPHVGHVVHDVDGAGGNAAVEWVRWLVPRLEEAAKRCRALAVEEFAVQRRGVSTYDAVYRRLLGARSAP